MTDKERYEAKRYLEEQKHTINHINMDCKEQVKVAAGSTAVGVALAIGGAFSLADGHTTTAAILISFGATALLNALDCARKIITGKTTRKKLAEERAAALNYYSELIAQEKLANAEAERE